MAKEPGGQRLRRADRLRRKGEFDLAYGTGERIAAKSFVAIVTPSATGIPRVGITLPKAVGNAVTRNALRRRLREAFRRHRDLITPPADVVIHVRPAARGAAYVRLEAEWLEAMRRYRDRRAREGAGR